MERGESELSPEEEKELAKCKWEDDWGRPTHREGKSVQEGAPEVRGGKWCDTELEMRQGLDRDQAKKYELNPVAVRSRQGFSSVTCHQTQVSERAP